MIVAAIGCGGSLPWGVRFFNRFSFRSKSQYDGREARGTRREERHSFWSPLASGPVPLAHHWRLQQMLHE